ncbi:MAG: hypothetical protein NXI09_12460 [Bacteroidetes bacterium]|nr:hypothetical protein [Bacteroidota bacterium]
MRFRLILLLLSSFPSLFLFGQREIDFEILEFNNDFEKANFQALNAGDTNYLAILIASSGRISQEDGQNYLMAVEELYQSLDSAKLKRKSMKRIVKTVFNAVHNNLLIKYEFENQFCEIFETGYYNCVSASAMYAYMFDRLGIHHQIMETPNHVYVVAYYDDESWVVESTDPQQGYFEVDEGYYSSYIDYLLEQKLISIEQVSSPNFDSILNSINPTEHISMARLSSIQYHNQALYDLDKDRPWSAVQNLLKALYLKPNGDFAGTQVILGNWLNKNMLQDPKFNLILDLSMSFMEEEERLPYIQSFEYYSKLFTEGHIDESKYENFYKTFKKHLAFKDSALQKVDETYIYAHNYFHYQNGAASKCYHGSKDLMKLNPHKTAYQSMMVNAIGLNIQTKLWAEENIVDSLETVHNSFPELLELGRWRNLVVQLYIYEAVKAVNEKRLRSAEGHLNSLENILQGQLPETIDEDAVALAYSKVAHYAYRRSTQDALDWIEQGLRYSPKSTLLLGLKDFYKNR